MCELNTDTNNRNSLALRFLVIYVIKLQISKNAVRLAQYQRQHCQQLCSIRLKPATIRIQKLLHYILNVHNIQFLWSNVLTNAKEGNHSEDSDIPVRLTTICWTLN